LRNEIIDTMDGVLAGDNEDGFSDSVCHSELLMKILQEGSGFI